ncbi:MULTISPECIES: post-transcriptional regulator [Aeribacillus]|uniref:Competence protein ComN n=1 Tax=Aeribacillus pallidus TaxID=33936 RepID=A0A223E9U7_9BACI|nr:post-transcriptional regulator [Aeribacillus pallidus]ASS92022.1 competence protein ComN [Aeribacillus pallidus]
MENYSVDAYRKYLRPFLKSKLEEFRLYGYDKMTEDELWVFLKRKKWKKIEGVRVHRLVEGIMSVKVSDFMNYTTIEFMKDAKWLDSKEGQEILKELT